MWHNVVQGSPEWLALRRGRFTGSKVHELIVKKAWNGDCDNLLTKGGKTYVRKSLCLSEQNTYESDAMIRGSQLEPHARLRFELQHNIKVQNTGFYAYENWLGFSSDGLTFEDNGRKGVAEIKCPLEQKHLLYCTCRTWQDVLKVSPLLCWEMCLPLLLLPKLDVCWFVSYYPEYIGTERSHLALFALCLERNNNLLTILADSLIRAKIYRDGLVKKLGL